MPEKLPEPVQSARQKWPQ